MLSSPRKPPWKTLRPDGSLRLSHQVKLSEELLEGGHEELAIGPPPGLALGAVREQRRPGMDGRIDVAEVPLVGRQLAVRVQVQIAQHQVELALGEVRVDHAQGNRVEGEVPGRVPGVLPGVGHRDDVVVEEVHPVAVADAARARGRRERVDTVLVEPAVDVEAVVLLRPDHPGERLAHDARPLGIDRRRRDRGVEGVGLAGPRGHRRGRRLARTARRPGRGRLGRGRIEERQPQPDRRRAAGRDEAPMVRGRLRAGERRVDRAGPARRRRASWKPSLTKGVAFGEPEQPLRVRLVVGDEPAARRPRPPASASRAPGGRPGRRGCRSADRRPQVGRPAGASPTPRCCGTRAWGGGGAAPLSGPRLWAVIADQQLVGRRPWRTSTSTSK